MNFKYIQFCNYFTIILKNNLRDSHSAILEHCSHSRMLMNNVGLAIRPPSQFLSSFHSQTNCGTWIRTMIYGFKGRSPTIRRSRNTLIKRFLYFN